MRAMIKSVVTSPSIIRRSPGVGNLRPCRPLSAAFWMNPNFAEQILLFLLICFCSSFIIFILILKPNIQMLSYKKQ
jgi:hypothetical protein